MKILLVIGSAHGGGAQRQWLMLAGGLMKHGHEVTLATLADRRCPELDTLVAEGLDWRVLGTVRRGATGRLRKLIDELEPTAIYSALWMTNLVAWRALRKGGSERLVWGIRSSGGFLSTYQRLTRRLCSLLSSRVPLAISNSEAGRRAAAELGFRPGTFVVVANGFDTDFFAPDHEQRITFRATHELGPNTALIGCVARLERTKDHAGLLKAFAELPERHQAGRLVLAGDGPLLSEIEQLATDLGIRERVLMLGQVSDPRSIYNALDVHVLNSIAEGTPNAVGEAMACGIACIATDVGDCRRLLGDNGHLVPSGDTAALTEAMSKLLDDPQQRAELGKSGRERIGAEFSVDDLTKATVAAFEKYLVADQT